jgi:hypothetical protein
MKDLIADIIDRERQWRQSSVHQKVLEGNIEQQLQAFDVKSAAPVLAEAAVAVCK